MPTPIGNFNWEYILKYIKEQKCILFIGPHAYTSKLGGNIEEELCATLLNPKNEASSYIKSYYDDDGFFHFNEPKLKSRGRVINEIRKFYQQSFPVTNKVLEKIAQIPFHVIITLSYDNLLQKAFNNLNLNYHYNFYFKGKPPKPYVHPSKDKPLIYNMLGDIEEDESLVLTNNDFFEYLTSIFEKNSMQDKLKAELFNAKCYIFLGFSFEKGYIQLLLRILELHSEDLKVFERFASNPKRVIKKNIFQDEFLIEFIKEETASFVNDFFDQCKTEQILKTPGTTGSVESFIQQKANLIRLMEKDEIVKVINLLKKLLDTYIHTSKETDFLGELTLITSRYNELENFWDSGRIKHEDFTIEKNHIRHSLLKLINEM